MAYRNFEELIAHTMKTSVKKNVAILCADEENTLEAAMMAADKGIIHALLIGNEARIKPLVAKLGFKPELYTIVPADTTEEVLAACLRMIHAGEADVIMKGLIETSDMMGMVVSKANGLRTDRLMSQFVIQQVPTYHKLMCIADVALVVYPDFEQKKQILLNTVDALTRMGFTDIKVAVLAGVDQVNPKMPEAVDGAELKRLNQIGEITGCTVEGPISYDLAVDKEAARIKGFNSPVAGDADLMLVPTMVAGNILAKSLVFSGNSVGGGIVVGAKVPVILTSRASSMQEKYHSLVLASAMNND